MAEFCCTVIMSICAESDSLWEFWEIQLPLKDSLMGRFFFGIHACIHTVIWPLALSLMLALCYMCYYWCCGIKLTSMLIVCCSISHSSEPDLHLQCSVHLLLVFTCNVNIHMNIQSQFLIDILALVTLLKNKAIVFTCLSINHCDLA